MTIFSIKKVCPLELQNPYFYKKTLYGNYLFYFVIDNSRILSVMNSNLVSTLLEMDKVSAQSVL